MKKIFVSIASFRDPGLSDTVANIVRMAAFPERLHLSVVSQDEAHLHPDLDFVKELGVGLDYAKFDYRLARGAGWARYYAQLPLNPDFEYVLQIDSHTRFIPSWDTFLEAQWKKASEKWPNVILTIYPHSFDYNEDGNPYLSITEDRLSFRPVIDSGEYLYEAKYKPYEGDEYGEHVYWFAAGFAFGRSDIFMRVPYDRFIAYTGEELAMAVRFHCAGATLVAPPRYSLFHYYGRENQPKVWDNDPLWDQIQSASKDRLYKLFEGDPLEGYGVLDLKKLQEYKKIAKVKYDAGTDTFIFPKKRTTTTTKPAKKAVTKKAGK